MFSAIINFFFNFSSCSDVSVEKKVEQRADSLRSVTGTLLELNYFSLDSALFRSTRDQLCGGTFFHVKHKKQVMDYIRSFLYAIRTDSIPCQEILSFVNHKDMKEIYREIEKKYSSEYRRYLVSVIHDALLRYQACFPGLSVPRTVIFVHSGFNYAFLRSGDALLCGLDMYLGRNHVFYDYAGFPHYKSRVMDSLYLPVDFIRACWMIQLDTLSQKNHLLDDMIHHGKLYYLLHLCFPEKHDSILMGYSSKQMEYVRKYEKKLWGYLTEKNRLFEQNLKTIHSFTSEGPFTSAISKECPPRIAYWFGYRIIRSFEEKHPEILPDALMRMTDSRKLLFEAKFNP